MIPFNSKTMNIAAIALLCYLVYTELGSPNRNKTVSQNDGMMSRYKVTIPPAKKHEEYNLLERAIYFLYKSQASESTAHPQGRAPQ